MAEYTIDELARRGGTNVRNVRAYQEKGLLPGPRREGRAGVYTEIHLSRLRLIGKLLDRGYSLGNIAELIDAWEQGQDIAQLMGLETAISSPWTTEVPTYMTLEQILELLGENASQEAFLKAIDLGVIVPEGDRVRVNSPRLFYAGVELVKAGVPWDPILEQLSLLRTDTERIAGRFVQLIVDQVFNQFGDDRLPPAKEAPRLAELVRRIRPLAQTVVDVELANALEKQVAAALGDRMARILGAIREGEKK